MCVRRKSVLTMCSKNRELKISVNKIIRIMPMKYDHVMTTIIESHDTYAMIVSELQSSIESHVNRFWRRQDK